MGTRCCRVQPELGEGRFVSNHPSNLAFQCSFFFSFFFFAVARSRSMVENLSEKGKINIPAAVKNDKVDKGRDWGCFCRVQFIVEQNEIRREFY